MIFKQIHTFLSYWFLSFLMYKELYVNMMRVYLSEDIADDKTGNKIILGGGRYFFQGKWHKGREDVYFFSSEFFELRVETDDGYEEIGSASDIAELVDLIHEEGVYLPSDVHNYDPGIYDVESPPDGDIYESDHLSWEQKEVLDTLLVESDPLNTNLEFPFTSASDSGPERQSKSI